MKLPELEPDQSKKSKAKPQPLRIPSNITIVTFERISDCSFDLQERYILRLSNE